jgi:hypothetical protein
MRRSAARSSLPASRGSSRFACSRRALRCRYQKREAPGIVTRTPSTRSRTRQRFLARRRIRRLQPLPRSVIFHHYSWSRPGTRFSRVHRRHDAKHRVTQAAVYVCDGRGAHAHARRRYGPRHIHPHLLQVSAPSLLVHPPDLTLFSTQPRLCHLLPDDFPPPAVPDDWPARARRRGHEGRRRTDRAPRRGGRALVV